MEAKSCKQMRVQFQRQPDNFNPTQIKEALTLLNEKLAQQSDNLKAKAKLAWESNEFRACPVLLLQAYAIEENNAKRTHVKITQVLPSSLKFPEAVEVPHIVRRKIMQIKNVFILSRTTFLFPKRNTTKLVQRRGTIKNPSS